MATFSRQQRRVIQHACNADQSRRLVVTLWMGNTASGRLVAASAVLVFVVPWGTGVVTLARWAGRAIRSSASRLR